MYSLVGVILLVIVSLGLAISFYDQLHWRYDYKIEGQSFDTYYDNVKISLNGKVIIDSAIKGSQIINDYFVAFAIPDLEVTCNYKPMLLYIDKPIYHILELKSSKLKSFKTKQKFENELQELSLLNKLELDYSVLERFFINERARIDTNSQYSECIKYLNLVDTRVIRYM